MKDKEGNTITTKQFFERWKEGIQQVTPLQQTKLNLFGAVLVIIGVVIGLVTTLITHTWWLFVILLGSFFLAAMTLLGMIQKYIVLSKLEKLQGGFNVQESTDGV